MIVKGEAVTIPVIQLPNLITLKGHRNDEIFFIRTLLDLAQRRVATDDYEILKASGLLRMLLLDAPCLIDLANANYRIQLRYTPVDIRLAQHSREGNEPVLIVYPVLANSQQLALQTDLARPSFTQTPCIKAHGTFITIADVIQYCAHKIGGVHYDPSMPNKPSQANFGLLLETETLYGNRLYANILKDIAFLVIKAAIPLLESIKNKQSE